MKKIKYLKAKRYTDPETNEDVYMSATECKYRIDKQVFVATNECIECPNNFGYDLNKQYIRCKGRKLY